MKRFLPILAMGFVGVALAQAPAFEDVDTNADGMITEEEAAAVEGLDFATCDANQDGAIAKEEYDACTAAE